MEFANRRLLLLNEDVPTKHATNNNNNNSTITTTTSSPPPESSTTVESPLQVSIRPVFASNVAYVFLILFTTFFFIGFVFLYFKQFSTETVSFRRRREEMSSSSSAEKAAAKAMMPVVAHEGENGECAICLEELGEGEEVKMIPYCKHVFHPECIDTWLDKHVTCPVCRCSKLCEKKQEVGSVSERREEE